MEKTSGVHHVGLGVRHLPAARDFYQESLEFNMTVEEMDESINSMADTFRNSPHSFTGFLKCQEAGGITLEVIKKRYPTPRPIHQKHLFGDIGVNKVTIAVRDVHRLMRDYREKISFCGAPKAADIPGLGPYEFLYGRDPEGNILEFVSSDQLEVDADWGGMVSVGVSVTDLERSKAWYQDHFDFDILVAEHDKFSGIVDDISECRGMQVKTCLLDSSKRENGGRLELFEVSRPRGRSIPFGTEWGDYGYMEICMFCPGSIHELSDHFLDQGLDVFQRPTNFGCDETGTLEYWFFYVRDPDGVFVETVGMREVQKSP